MGVSALVLHMNGKHSKSSVKDTSSSQFFFSKANDKYKQASSLLLPEDDPSKPSFSKSKQHRNISKQ